MPRAKIETGGTPPKHPMYGIVGNRGQHTESNSRASALLHKAKGRKAKGTRPGLGGAPLEAGGEEGGELGVGVGHEEVLREAVAHRGGGRRLMRVGGG